jgi:hypothetical protein
MAVVAHAEVTAYRLARRALPHLIPQVLWYSGDNENVENHQEEGHRWAIIEYIGPSSPTSNNDDELATFWTKRMIKVRPEFGFDEPHPRWGRLPIPDCLHYARLLLDQVIVPLHKYCWDHQQELSQSSSPCRFLCDGKDAKSGNFYYTYSHMVDIYQAAWVDLHTASVATTKETLNNGSSFFQMAVSTLQKCIQQLTHYRIDVPDNATVPPTPVLVHMDLQPQNLLWNRQAQSVLMENSGSNESSFHWYVKGVLDWEDAAWADPRFELMLLARKVCANRVQANEVWAHYQNKFPQLLLGPIDPWLHLETVHSLTTLLLQFTNTSAGRSPWEGPSDLRGKIEREFARLVQRGWDFCEPVAAKVLTNEQRQEDYEYGEFPVLGYPSETPTPMPPNPLVPDHHSVTSDITSDPGY